ncbi:hypothetical protein [Streptomyces sp. NPDC127040]|uniref:hypothetical protein n=1 Tax=Streptomyces sp. NPDC127040 TaxID=3347116 RepID=UPI00364DCCC4
MNEQKIAERFPKDVAQHEMTIVLDDDLHRHLRFAAPQPNSWIHWFEIVTWPGYLAITGDMESYAAKADADTFMITRTQDMFTFFRGNDINPRYWSQKVAGGAGVKEFCRATFRKEVLEYIGDSIADHPDLIDEVYADILSDESIRSVESAHEALHNFTYKDFRFDDTHELGFERFTTHFLWCCHAIRWGIGQYDAAKKQAVAS